MKMHQCLLRTISALALIVASISAGCVKENTDINKLEAENKALRKRVELLESQWQAVVASKPEINEDVLALGRELQSSPKEFVGKQVKLYCRFGGFENKFLDEASGSNFPANYYIGLIAQNGKEMNEPVFNHLFMNKKEAKDQGVYGLRENDPITAYGMITGSYRNEPWMEVYLVKKGWI